MATVAKGRAKRFKPETRKCRFCKTPFLASRDWSKFCSMECRTKWHKSGGGRKAVLVDVICETFEAMPARLETALRKWHRKNFEPA